jgi:hypothetical protein
MKTLKHKLLTELHALEQQEIRRGERDLTEDTLHMAYKVAKTLHYLCQIEKDIADMPAEASARTHII